MKVVIDASVALKWQFEEEEASEPATVLLKDFIDGEIELTTITLFPYEILSAINVAVSRKRISESVGKKAVHYLTSLRIEENSFDGLIEMAFRMAREYRLSTYDCAYMALAQREECDFYTGDKKLHHATRTHLPWVKWIGDY